MGRLTSSVVILLVAISFPNSAEATEVEWVLEGKFGTVSPGLAPPFDSIAVGTPFSAKLLFDDATPDQCVLPSCITFGNPLDSIGRYAAHSFHVSTNNFTAGGGPLLIEVWNNYDLTNHGYFADFLTVSHDVGGTTVQIYFDSESAGIPPLTLNSDVLPPTLIPLDWPVHSVNIYTTHGRGYAFGDIDTVTVHVVPEPNCLLPILIASIVSLNLRSLGKAIVGCTSHK